MVLPALFAAVASSTLLYVGTPRIPTYHVHSPTLSSICPRSLLGGKLSATVRAGLEVTNENFLGADVHSASFDLYYEDWRGTLRHIGRMRDSHAAEIESRDAEMAMTAAAGGAMKEAGAGAGGGMFASASEVKVDEAPVQRAKGGGSDTCPQHEREGNGGTCPRPKVDQSTPTPSSTSASPSESPLFAVPARNTAASHPDLVTINLHSVPLSLTLKMVWDLLSSFGKVSMLTSGVLHVKQPSLSLPLSVGIVCDNAVDLLKLPWRISGRDCAVKSAGPGWGRDIAHSGSVLREWVLRSHADTGKVLDRRRERGDGEAEGGGTVIEWEDIDTEHVVEWNAF